MRHRLCPLGNEICEAMESSLSNKDPFFGCALMHSNEFNAALGDMDKLSANRDKRSFFAKNLMETDSLKQKM